MKYLFFTVFLLTQISGFSLSPSNALKKLIEGNRRFYTHQTLEREKDRRAELKKAQAPFAVIVACADSRVAPEIVFDQGLGELFVIRVAGNVIGPLEMESIYYAVKHLGSSCVLVMGHENCGAVSAVVQDKTEGVDYIAQLIEAAVLKAEKTRTKDVLKTAVKYNAQAVSRFITRSPFIAESLKAKKICVKPAYYNFQTGKVEILKYTR